MNVPVLAPAPAGPAELTFEQPEADTTFKISSAPEWPSIEFRTNQPGPHTWTWRIAWKSFTRSGTACTEGNAWDARDAIENLGGTLTVTACANGLAESRSVNLVGTNPSLSAVRSYLSGSGRFDGFEEIDRVSRRKNFNRRGQPTKSVDDGYGMGRVTAPAVTFEQCWNWQLNLDGRAALFEPRPSPSESLFQLGSDGLSP